MLRSQSVLEIPGVQNPVKRHAKRTGWLTWKMKIEGINGCPDCIFMKQGRVIWMEFKSPTGRLSAQQTLRIAELIAHGIEVHVISDPAVGIAILDAAFEDDLL